MNVKRIALLCFTMPTLLAFLASGCGKPTPRAQEKFAVLNMKQIWIHIEDYRESNDGQFPTNLGDIQEHLRNNKPYLLESFKEIMKNPYTRSNPGYKYVAVESPDSKPISTVLYQIEDGQIRKDLDVIFADGSVGKLDTDTPITR